jgi:Domain of unknown function (DUF3883)
MEWSRNEVEAAVADYFHMLLQELAGQSYNKTTHRRALLNKLNSRTDGAVEKKHQNISAILIELGYPYISGYKPLRNYQALIAEVIEIRLQADSVVDSAVLFAASLPAQAPLVDDFSKVLVDAPEFDSKAADSASRYIPNRTPQKRDYFEREARNVSLGAAGEAFALNFEHQRLKTLGKSHLADRVEHVSVTKGDGLGFDILSFDASGRERFIEVKTTSFGKETPFYITRGELSFAKEHDEQFHLYRLFDFRREPKIFALPGQVGLHCSLSPLNFMAHFP